MGVPVAELRLAGGGARSPLWAQILADALGCPVVVADGQEYGAKGAVINAGVAVGVYASYADGVARTVRAARHFAPDAARGEDYAVLSADSIATCAKPCCRFGSSAHGCSSVSQKVFEPE